MLVCVFFVQLAHETAGAACTRCSLRPLFGGARKFLAKLGRNARRECEGVSTRHCEEPSRPPKPAFGRRRMRRPRPPKLNERRRKQSILSLCGEMDCFAYARNDGLCCFRIHTLVARGGAKRNPG